MPTAVATAVLVMASCGGGSPAGSTKDVNQAVALLPPDGAVSSVLPDLHVRLAADRRSWSTGEVEGAQLVVVRQWFGQADSQDQQPGADFVFAAEARVATLPTTVTEAQWAKGQQLDQGQARLSPPTESPSDLVESFDPSGDQYQASFFSAHVDYWMELIASRSPEHDADFNRLVNDWLLQLRLP